MTRSDAQVTRDMLRAALNEKAALQTELAVLEIETDIYRKAVERWRFRALSAERVWACVAHDITKVLRPDGLLREADRKGLQLLTTEHLNLLKEEWVPDPDADVMRRRVTDSDGGASQ